VAALLLAACAHLGVQSWQASVRYGADPRNPYAYLHTSPDFMRLVQRVADLSALHADRERMLIRVAAGPYEQWPLPWYLRRMARVGYWPRAEAAGPFEGTPVIIASQEQAGAVEAALGDRYISEMYGLRPEVFLTVFIERDLWARYLAQTGHGR
jgi:predicted membrane-bound mannosyltransferase